jgi:hypothetical protein
MQTQQGKFILFDLPAFSSWLEALEVNRVIQLIQNHHTFIPSYSDFNGSNHFDRLRSMEASHLQRGFAEIAQNLTTFPDGTVAVCRAFDTAPAGIKGANAHGLCIENLGDFDIGKDSMTSAQKNLIPKLNALLCHKFNLTPNTDSIVYHHWFDLNTGQRTNGTGTTKTCPGTGFFGGNTVSSAQENFIPLITQELANLASSADTSTATALFSAQVTASALNVRSQPNISGNILGQLANGTVVQIFEEQNGWGRIDASDSKWIKESFLQKVSSNSSGT